MATTNGKQSDLSLSTIHIVIKFMNDHFEKKSTLNWQFIDNDDYANCLYRLWTHGGDNGTRVHNFEAMNKNYRKNLLTVSRALMDIAKEEINFIKGKQDLRNFERMVETTTKILNAKMSPPSFDKVSRNGIPLLDIYEKFERVGLEMIRDREPDWESIITLLLFSSEVAVKLIEISQESERQPKVLQIIACVVKFIENHCIDWILEQSGGWKNVVDHNKQLNHEATTEPEESQQQTAPSTLETLCSRRAIKVGAILALGLYLCSKLSLQS